jgi:hypothetical protein
MRVKSRWFKDGQPKSATEVAGAAAFIAWRVAQNAVKTMRAAKYELPPGPQYFAFVAEFLAFLVVAADRIAHAHGDAAWRIEFTTAMANRAGETLADNEADLLGAAAAGDIKRRFIAMVNERAADYAHFEWSAEGPDYGMLRYLGHRVAEAMAEDERSWAVAQVIECEAPEAAGMLRRAMNGLLGLEPKQRARGERAASGE